MTYATDTNEYGYRVDLARESWVERLDRIHAMQAARGLTPAATIIVERDQKTGR